MAIRIPAALAASRARGPEWAAWLDLLPRRVAELVDEWELRPDLSDGSVTVLHGFCSVVLPVSTPSGRRAALKVGLPDEGRSQEHLALRYWAGRGAVELLRADPHRAALLLEWLPGPDLTSRHDLEACELIAGLYRRLHIPAPPQLPTLTSVAERATEALRRLEHDSRLPRRLVDQAISLGDDLAGDPATSGTLIHTDLHYTNVLAAEREPWLVIDPKPLRGDPHYEIAPLLWNRWDDLDGNIRAGVRSRFHTVVDVAELDEDRARDWVVVRMVHNAMWAITGPTRPLATADRDWLTVCVSVAKAVQG